MRTTKELRQDYQRMDSTWPRPLPPVTFEELKKAYPRLRKKFAPSWPKRKMKFVQSSGNRWFDTSLTTGAAHQVRLVVKLNPERGWDGFVHWLSHRLAGGHDQNHLETEWKMIKYVRSKGWLEGKLKPKEKPPAPVVSLAERRIKMVAKRAAKAAAALAKAMRLQRAADRRVKKWQRKVKYYERTAA